MGLNWTFESKLLPESYMLNFECCDRLPALFGDPEEKLWPFVFAMGFIFNLRASQYIMSFDRASKPNIMAVRICGGIPFQILGTMIYYGAQSDIRVKTFARWNSPESYMLNFVHRDRLPALFGDPEEKLWSLYLWLASYFNLEHLNILYASNGIRV